MCDRAIRRRARARSGALHGRPPPARAVYGQYVRWPGKFGGQELARGLRERVAALNRNERAAIDSVVQRTPHVDVVERRRVDVQESEVRAADRRCVQLAGEARRERAGLAGQLDGGPRDAADEVRAPLLHGAQRTLRIGTAVDRDRVRIPVGPAVDGSEARVAHKPQRPMRAEAGDHVRAGGGHRARGQRCPRREPPRRRWAAPACTRKSGSGAVRRKVIVPAASSTWMPEERSHGTLRLCCSKQRRAPRIAL